MAYSKDEKTDNNENKYKSFEKLESEKKENTEKKQKAEDNIIKYILYLFLFLFLFKYFLDFYEMKKQINYLYEKKYEIDFNNAMNNENISNDNEKTKNNKKIIDKVINGLKEESSNKISETGFSNYTYNFKKGTKLKELEELINASGKGTVVITFNEKKYENITIKTDLKNITLDNLNNYLREKENIVLYIYDNTSSEQFANIDISQWQELKN